MADFTEIDELSGLGDEFGSIFQDSMKVLEGYTSRLNQKQRARMEADHAAQMANLEEIMESMTEIFESVEGSLSDVDKQLYQTLLINRQKDLKKLDRDYKRRHRELMNTQRGFFDNLEERFDAISESLARIAAVSTALGVKGIQDDISDTAQTNLEMRRNLKARWDLSEEAYEDFTDRVAVMTKNLSRQYDGKVSSTDVYENIWSLTDEFNIASQGLAETLAQGLTRLELGAGVEGADNYSGLYRIAANWEESADELTNTFNNLAVAGNQLGYATGPEQFIENMNLMSDSIAKNAESNEDAQRRMAEIAKTTTMLEDSFIGSQGWFESLKEIQGASPDQLADLASKYAFALEGTGYNIRDIQKMLSEGRTTDVSSILLDGMADEIATGNSQFINFVKDEFGMDSSDFSALQQMVRDNPHYFADMQKELDSVYDTHVDGMDRIDKAIESVHVSWTDRIKNTFGSTGLGQAVTNFLDELDVSVVDMYAMFELGKESFKLGRGLLGKVLGKKTVEETAEAATKGLFPKLFGKGSKLGSMVDDGVKGASKLFKGIKLGSVADDGLKGFSQIISGTSDDIAKVATSGLSKTASGALSALGFAVDGLFGGLETKNWFGEDAGAQQTVSSVLGGIVGGSGAGWFDKDKSFGDKALNTVGNTAKYASAGAALGSVIPGLGTAVGAAVGAGLGLISSSIGGEKIAESFDGAITSVKDFGKDIWAKVEDVSVSIKDSFMDIPDKLSSAADSLKDAGASIKSWISDKYGAVKDWASDKWDGVKDWAVNLFDGSHENGLWKVPRDNYRAILHRGEAVLTKEDADDWRSDIKRRKPADYVKSLMDGVVSGISKALGFLGLSSGGDSDYPVKDGVLDSFLGNAVDAPKFTGKKADFMRMITEGAVAAYYKYGLLPSITMAQGALESGWGDSAIGYNLFGYKAGSKWDGKKQYVWTTEEINGKRIKVQDWFRDYASYAESILDYAKLLGTADRYAGVRNATNYIDAASELGRSGYATASNYGSSIAKMIKDNKFSYFDNPSVLEKLADEYGIPKYEKGTDFVPKTQIALVHKGEQIIPAREVEPSSSVVASDNSEVVQVLRWGFEFLAKKIENIAPTVVTATEEVKRKESKTEAVFRLGGALA